MYCCRVNAIICMNEKKIAVAKILGKDLFSCSQYREAITNCAIISPSEQGYDKAQEVWSDTCHCAWAHRKDSGRPYRCHWFF